MHPQTLDKPLKQAIFFGRTGGEMGALIDAYPWETHPLGRPEHWPASLRTIVGLMLHSKHPMFMFWGPENYCFYNDAYRPSLGADGRHPAMLGTAGEEAWQDIWHIIKPMIDDVKNTGISTYFEDQLLPIYRNGKFEDVYWTYSYSLLANDEQQPQGVFVTCNETTQKVKAAIELDHAHKELSFAVDSLSLATFEYSTATQNVVCNARMAAWFGITAGEAIPVSELIAMVQPQDQMMVLATLQEALQADAPGGFECTFSLVNASTGTEMVVLAKGQAWKDDEGNTFRLHGNLQDVTRRKQAEKQLQESEKRFRTLAQNSPDIITRLDANFVYLYANPSLDSVGFHAADTIVGMHLDEVGLPVELALYFKEHLALVFADKKPQSLEYQGLEGRFYHTRLVPEFDDDGQCVSVLSISTDVTERRLNEDAVKAMNATLEQKVELRTEELRNKNIELESINAELASFSYLASHDLQEPLRKIRAFSNYILEKENFSGKTEDYFKRIIAAGERMQNLINDLLDFSRANTVELEFEDCDLNAVLRDVKQFLHESIIDKKATIACAELPVVHGVPVQLTQLFTNLLDNAIKYSKEHEPPRIQISAHTVMGSAIEHSFADPKRRYHALAFADNGIGFEDQYSQKIFELFQRLHGKNEYSGTGIGLAIVKKIVRNHNGMIIAQSKQDEGSVFTVYLPQ